MSYDFPVSPRAWKHSCSSFFVCVFSHDFNENTAKNTKIYNFLQKILKKLKDGLEGVYNFELELEKRFNESPSKIKKIKAPIRVYLNNDTSDDYTILEVKCKNAPGVLFQITQCISKLNLQIYNASISTYGTRVTDIFYVKDLFGQKISDKSKIKQIKNNLLEILNKS